MANGRNKGGKTDSGRDAGGFVALPWAVLDCPAYAALSHPAKALLMEVARQFVRDNNGNLLLAIAYLSTRGWKSSDVIDRAKAELLKGGFIFETVKGGFPKKASRYAITWQRLDRLPGYDPGAEQTFKRGAYRFTAGQQKNAGLIPSHGAKRPFIAPSGGEGKRAIAPLKGTMKAAFDDFPSPSDGQYLDMPSVARQAPH